MTPSASGRSDAGLVAAWLPVAICSLAIIVASSIPATRMPAGTWWRHDKLIHGAVYAALAGSVVRGLVHGAVTARIRPAVALAVTAAVLFGVTDEIHQIATPGRDSSWGDLLADGVGALFGAGPVGVWYYLARRTGAQGRKP